MANNQTSLKAVNSDGRELHVQHTSSDSPILPVAAIVQLNEIDPKLVEFVVEETRKEAAHRRGQSSRINTFVFAEKLIGIIAAAVIVFFVFGLSGYLIMHDHDAAGGLLCTGGLVSIVALFVNRQNNDADIRASKLGAGSKRQPRKPSVKKIP